jgi:nucleoside-diphosphate-sugar epimerase
MARNATASSASRWGGLVPDAEVVAGDATDPAFTTAVCAGADSVSFCLNASSYAGSSAEFPPLQRGVLTGAARAGARLVVLDNLYGYGPPHGQRLVETMRANPTSGKAATRAAMTAALLHAHDAGQVEVAIGRASDYFGPGTTQSALGETVFGWALTGRTAQVMGNPDQLHSYSYTPDVAAGLAILATAAGTTGQIWHLPVPETRTTRQLIEAVYQLAGHQPRLVAAGRTALMAIGITAPWVVDDSLFRASFGDHSTPIEEALEATLAWYRDRVAVPIR